MVVDHASAIDVGTQSVRSIVFDPSGNLVAMGRVAVEPYVSPEPGWAEQDPEVWWTAIGEACRRLWANPNAKPDSVAGVGLTTQRTTIVASDENGKALRPGIVWLGQGRAEGLPRSGAYGASRSAQPAFARPSLASRPTPRRTGSRPMSPRAGRGSGITAYCRPG